MVTVSVPELPRSVAKIIGFSRASKTHRDDVDSEVTVDVVDKQSDAVDLYLALPTMFEKKDVAGVKRVLEQNSPDIPELLVLSIIEFIFVCENEEDLGQVEREKMLTMAFDVPITDSLMLSHLCQLDFGLAVKMIDFVNLSIKLESALSGGGHTDRFQRLVQWMGLLLNAQYTNVLLLSRDDDGKVAELLGDVASNVEELEVASSAFASVIPLAELLKGKKYREPSFANTTYCVEVVEL